MSENNENNTQESTEKKETTEAVVSSEVNVTPKTEAPSEKKEGFQQLAGRQSYKDLRLGVAAPGESSSSNKRIRKLGDLFTGRRKSSIARVKLVKGTGKIMINNVEMEKFFPRKMWQQMVLQPLVLLSKEKEYDVTVNVHGGGNTGQAGAVRLGIARCLDTVEENSHKALRHAGFLTRDPRKVERKKFGLRKARRAVQFSKR